MSATVAIPQLEPGADRQRTLARPAVVRGVGFVTGADVVVRLTPADVDSGLTFIRTDLPGRPQIPARVEFALDRRRRTSLGKGTAVVEMVEHVLSALCGMGVDNCGIELDAAELPGLDGSARAFVEAIDAAGLVPQSAARKPFVIQEPIVVADGDAMIALHPGAVDRFVVTFNLDYDHPGVGKQSATQEIDAENYRANIASARTFVLEKEVAALKAQGLGSRATARDLLVFDAAGKPVDNSLRYVDECARHKLLDVVGDLALFGRPLCGQALAHRSGHRLNVAVVRKLLASIAANKERAAAAGKPVMDAIAIQRTLKHRYPFLLVDRVLELEPQRRAVGLKNVTINEPFFQGHWPGRPVMPGVLIVEAMAQTAGLMLTEWQRNGGLAFISSIADVKFRRPVVPGDQLRMVCEAVRVKDRVASLKVRATVQGELVAEARMNFVRIVEKAAAA